MPDVKPIFGSKIDANHPLSKRLVACWLFNEGGGAYSNDISGNRIGGVLTNGPTWTMGRAGSAILFNGTNQYIDCGDPSQVDFGAGNFSITVWFKPTSISTTQMIIAKDLSGQRQFNVQLGSSQITLNCFDTVGSNIQLTGNSLGLVANAWNHLVFLRRGTSFECWTGGVFRTVSTAGSWNGTMGATSSRLNIGRRSFVGFESYYGGLIDDVRIYGRALLSNEILQLYKQPYRFIKKAANITLAEIIALLARRRRMFIT